MITTGKRRTRSSLVLTRKIQSNSSFHRTTGKHFDEFKCLRVKQMKGARVRKSEVGIFFLLVSPISLQIGVIYK